MVPCEYAIWKILPKIRRNLTLEMRKKGIPQRSIAKFLGTSEAGVSNYIKGKRGAIEIPDALQKKILLSAEKIINGAKAKNEICKLCRKFRDYERIEVSC